MNTIRRIRWWISHLFYINSRLGNISLNIAAICAVGAILSNNANVVAIAANGGKMPVVVEKGYVTGDHVIADDTTRLQFLGDWIAIDIEAVPPEQKNFPLEGNIVVSPGDVGTWVFASMSILALLLSFMCALWHYTKKIWFV